MMKTIGGFREPTRWLVYVEEELEHFIPVPETALGEFKEELEQRGCTILGDYQYRYEAEEAIENR